MRTWGEDQDLAVLFVAVLAAWLLTAGIASADPLENVLVFSKTAGFRHDSIPEGIAAIQKLGAANDFDGDGDRGRRRSSPPPTSRSTTPSSSSPRPATSSTTPSRPRSSATSSAGGGFVGIHAAADTEYGWDWYGQMLGGYFRNHPPGTPTASVDIDDGNEPSTERPAGRWTRTDEWYNYQSPGNPSVNGRRRRLQPRD